MTAKDASCQNCESDKRWTGILALGPTHTRHGARGSEPCSVLRICDDGAAQGFHTLEGDTEGGLHLRLVGHSHPEPLGGYASDHLAQIMRIHLPANCGVCLQSHLASQMGSTRQAPALWKDPDVHEVARAACRH